MHDIVMKIKRSEYLELKRVQAVLATENSELKKENDILKAKLAKAVTEKKVTETKKKEANK